MANFSEVYIVNATTMSNVEGDKANFPLELSYILIIIVNSIACVPTFLLNVLVIMAVKKRLQLRTNSNILLACLAATDALTGLIGQPSLILWKTFLLVGASSSQTVEEFHYTYVSAVPISALLHLILVTFERLVVVKFTMRYPNVITERKIKIAVIVVWFFSLICGVLRQFNFKLRFIFAFLLVFYILFNASAYVILYRETRRHQKMIRTQQLPQDEWERFAKENKALTTTVLVVGDVIVFYLPGCVYTVFITFGSVEGSNSLVIVWIGTFGMLNSLINPLIYCWRQREMRKFVFGGRVQEVGPCNA